MIKELDLINNDYKLVYDLKSWLKDNPEDMELTHKVTLDNSTTSGLKGSHGLYGTDEWWENIEDGSIESYMISGTIIDLNEKNEFMEANKVTTIKLDHEEREIYGGVGFTNEQIERKYKDLYKVGNKTVIFYILDELKEDDTWNSIVEGRLGIIPLINKIYIKQSPVI
ncbi:hypothetical protein [Acinetobacter piscicola]|uniref:hypothetical protein n=1 Tax=Acinetobacter piscicola TaxID=2006115 RepID=UPI0010202BB4|nr:hypothetical protein [Acinetobacter piscicola]RYL24702.1 hypothetical protein EWP19_15120 [Acinetobacter piscicola]